MVKMTNVFSLKPRRSIARMADRCASEVRPWAQWMRESQRCSRPAPASSPARSIASKERYDIDADRDSYDIVAWTLEPGDTVLTMGAGNVWTVGEMLLERLAAEEVAAR